MQNAHYLRKLFIKIINKIGLNSKAVSSFNQLNN